MKDNAEIPQAERFSLEFQYAAARAVIEDPKMLPTYYKIIDQNMFSNQWLRLIIGVAKDLYKSLGYKPGWMEVKHKALQKATQKYDDDYINETIDEIRKVPDTEIEFAKREFLGFCKWKTMVYKCKDALKQLGDVCDDTTYRKICRSFNELIGIEEDATVTTKMTKEFIHEILTDTDEDRIPTYIPGMDERIGGGLEKGGIGYFLAPTGFGKTTFSSIIAFNSAINGHRVLQIYFEDNYKDLGRKHLAKLYNLYISQLKNMTDEFADRLVDEKTDETSLRLLDENLRMCRMEDKKTTVEDIEEKMNEFAELEGWRPDVIIIDYFSCLKMSSNSFKDKTIAESDAMRKIKNIALTYNVAMWVMQQTNRQGASGENKGSMGNVQGSYEATQPVSLWLELARTKEQKHENRADIIIVKCRHANGDPVFNDITFDNGRMLIDCTTEEKDAFDPNYYEAEQDRYEKGEMQLVNKIPNEQD